MTGHPRTIGLLYESDEWSDHKLAAEIVSALAERGLAATVRLINMEDPGAVEDALVCDLLVSRVFASALFRGHERSHESMRALIEASERVGIPMLNPGIAHSYEIDKHASTYALAEVGIAVPRMQAYGEAAEIDPRALEYPCIIKPNCGGRTTHTAILSDEDEARSFLDDAPEGKFLVEDLLIPDEDHLTRIEIVDDDVALIVKRSVAESGLSGYHEGSTYAPYPNPDKALVDDALLAARTLSFSFGSFDVIESGGKRFFIDANSVSNVSEDCTELLGCDLMAMHAKGIARAFEGLFGTDA